MVIAYRMPSNILHISATASGWAEWALAHPEFGSSFNPTPRGAGYAHHITACQTRFENLTAFLIQNYLNGLNCCMFISCLLILLFLAIGYQNSPNGIVNGYQGPANGIVNGYQGSPNGIVNDYQGVLYKGAFTNYVNMFFTFFEHVPTLVCKSKHHRVPPRCNYINI